MTQKRDTQVERAARIAAIVLATVAGALAACSGGDRPPASGGSSSSAPPVGPRDAGSSDGEGGKGSVNDCNTRPNDAPPYPITFSAAEAPLAFAGGAIPDGTYFETSEIHYGEASGMSPITSPGITLTIAGSDLRYGAYTSDGAYVPMAALLRVDRADAGDPDAGDDAGTGDTLVITKRCPVAGGSLGPQPYSVVGKDFTIGFGTFTVTYTKQ